MPFYRKVTSIFIPIASNPPPRRRLIPLHVTAIRAPKVVRCQQRQTDADDADGRAEDARRFCIPNINPTERRVIRLHLKAKTTTVSLSRPLLVFSGNILDSIFLPSAHGCSGELECRVLWLRNVIIVVGCWLLFRLSSSFLLVFPPLLLYSLDGSDFFSVYCI